MGKRSRKRRKKRTPPLPVQEEPVIESKESELSAPSPSDSWTAKLLQWAITLASILIAWGLGAWIRLDWVDQYAQLADQAQDRAQNIQKLADKAENQGMRMWLKAAQGSLEQAAELGEKIAQNPTAASSSSAKHELIMTLNQAVKELRDAAQVSSGVEAEALKQEQEGVGQMATQATALPNYQWQEHYLPTTNDSYYYYSIIHQASNTDALKEDLKNHPRPTENGPTTLLGTALVRCGGFHVADVITYLPVFVAGLLAVPMVLLGRLYGSTIAGCCSACLAVVAFSYFNRTNAGYFDTDMFSLTVPALILYFLLRAHKDESLPFLLLGAVGIYIYPFFYVAGVPIVTALGISFIGFRMLAWLVEFLVKKKHPPAESINFTLGAIPLICLAIIYCSTTTGINWANNPEKPLIGLAWLFASAIGLVLLLPNILAAHFRATIHPSHPRYALVPIAAVCLIWMVGFSNSFDRIRNATLDYLPGIKAKLTVEKPQEETKQNPIIYKNVKETIIEARKSPWSELMQRISGSSWGCMLALLGYLLLVILYPELMIAIPFIGIGVFAHWGGHRFTIHAVPIAAMSAVFLPLCLLELVRRFKKWSEETVPIDCSWPNKPHKYFSQFGNWIFAVGGVRIIMPLLALALIWPNIQIAKERAAILPTVLKQPEVQLLDDLRKASKPGDYVHTWWDWGTAVWCHAERNVLTHPGSQSFDTFICAKMLMTGSPRLSAHLGRTAVEHYHHGGHDGFGGLAVDHIFGSGKQSPPEALKSLEEHLPIQPTRDVFMYLPYRLLNFYHVLHMFSERDLTTGKENPFRRFETFHAWQRQGKTIQLYGTGNDGRPTHILIDLAQLTLTDMRRGVTPMQAKAVLQSGQYPFPKVIRLRLKNRPPVHVKRIQAKSDGFVVTSFNDKTGFIPQSEVQMIYPTGWVKQVEQLDTQESHSVEGEDAQKPGLHVIYSQNPPMAVLADEAAYKSQLVQMLILGRPDQEYFEQIAANATGRVFKLKK